MKLTLVEGEHGVPLETWFEILGLNIEWPLTPIITFHFRRNIFGCFMSNVMIHIALTLILTFIRFNGSWD